MATGTMFSLLEPTRSITDQKLSMMSLSQARNQQLFTETIS